MRVLIFGDSIAHGYYDLEKGGWVQRLLLGNLAAKVHNPANTHTFFNIGISGNKTSQVTSRLVSETRARLWTDEPVLLVIAVGLNDTRLENGTPISSVEQFRGDVEALYEQTKLVSEHVVCVGLTTVDEAESAPWKYNSGDRDLVWQNERIKQFDLVLQNFCQTQNVPFVPVYDAFMKRQLAGEKLHADGIHPNEAGHQLIAELVGPTIEALLQ